MGFVCQLNTETFMHALHMYYVLFFFAFFFFPQKISDGGWSCAAQTPEQALNVPNSTAIAARLRVRLYRKESWFYYKTS